MDRRSIWEQYVLAWKLIGREEKAEALRKSNAIDSTYRDPLVTCHGHDELLDYMMAIHAKSPGVHFITTYFQSHHDGSIARWNMVTADGQVLGDGISYARYNDQGLLAQETGFFELPDGTGPSLIVP